MNKPNKPNLFNYATSELTQDAFFAWLFAWLENEHDADDSKKIQDIGIRFLEKFLGQEVDSSRVIGKTKVYRQKFKIDVIISLEGLDLVIIIEDKIHGKDRIEKQKEYSDKILNSKNKKDGFTHIISRKQIKHVYIKTGLIDGEDLLLKKKPINAPIIDVKKINEIFNGSQIKNDIFNAYKEFIAIKATKRKESRDLIFSDQKFNSLNFHTGQHLFFNQLIEDNLKSIRSEKPYLKLGTSRGKPWAELWIVEHSKPKEWEFEDAIFYRIEKRKIKEKALPYLSMRQYHRYNKDNFSISHSKRIRYKNLRDLFNKQLTNFSFTNSISPLSDNPKNYGSDFGAFVFREDEIIIEDFIKELIQFNNSIITDIEGIIFT